MKFIINQFYFISFILNGLANSTLAPSLLNVESGIISPPFSKYDDQSNNSEPLQYGFSPNSGNYS